MLNTAFEYLYRDGGNNKLHGRIIFAGCITNEENLRFTKALEDGDKFIATQVDIPNVANWAVEPHSVCEFDHCWHEAAGFVVTGEEPTDEHNRTITQFVNRVELESRSTGWGVFDPEEYVREISNKRLAAQES